MMIFILIVCVINGVFGLVMSGAALFALDNDYLARAILVFFTVLNLVAAAFAIRLL